MELSATLEVSSEGDSTLQMLSESLSSAREEYEGRLTQLAAEEAAHLEEVEREERRKRKLLQLHRFYSQERDALRQDPLIEGALEENGQWERAAADLRLERARLQDLLGRYRSRFGDLESDSETSESLISTNFFTLSREELEASYVSLRAMERDVSVQRTNQERYYTDLIEEQRNSYFARISEIQTHLNELLESKWRFQQHLSVLERQNEPFLFGSNPVTLLQSEIARAKERIVHEFAP